jgi:hypothetical protein
MEPLHGAAAFGWPAPEIRAGTIVLGFRMEPLPLAIAWTASPPRSKDARERLFWAIAWNNCLRHLAWTTSPPRSKDVREEVCSQKSSHLCQKAWFIAVHFLIPDS